MSLRPGIHAAMRRIEATYGEDLDDLLSVIVDLHYRRYAQDKVQISSHDLPESRVAPLVRALMRAEAEVLLDKAEAGEETSYPKASQEQRQGEAFARVFRAAGLADGERSRHK